MTVSEEPIITYRMLPGPLTLAVMGHLWREGSSTLTATYWVVCRGYKQIALSTLSTTITRLLQRRWIERVEYNRYRPLVTREQLRDAIVDIIDQA